MRWRQKYREDLRLSQEELRALVAKGRLRPTNRLTAHGSRVWRTNVEISRALKVGAATVERVRKRMRGGRG